MDAGRDGAQTTALRLTGRDALAVLHRVTTQRLDDLAPGSARTTLWCDFRGRLLHRACVVHTEGGAVWLLREDAPGAELAAVVDRAVFRDDVKFQDLSLELPVRLVADVGPAPAIGDAPELVGLEDGFALAVGDAAAGFTALDEATTIERGRARHGAEIIPGFTPYETNLASHVHLAKGCYTGQETLQRLVTYDSVRRRLVRFAGAGAPPAPQALIAGGEPAGVLTRTAARGNAWLALAVVKIATLEAGEPLALESGVPLEAPYEFPVALPVR